MWACPPKCYRSHPPCSCVCHESHNLENSIPLTKIVKMPVPKQECYFLKMVDEDDLVFTKLGTFKKLGFFGTFFFGNVSAYSEKYSNAILLQKMNHRQ